MAAATLPPTTAFRAASVILPTIDETVSLEKTAAVILAEAGDALEELLIVVCERTTPASLETAAALARKHPELVVIHRQKLPFLGGAVREAFDLARGSHVIMMASDLETDPADVRVMVAMSRRRPDAVITASRWRAGGSFHGLGPLSRRRSGADAHGYDPVKLAANWAFQKFFSVLYGTALTDMTFGYRLFPTALVQAIAWEELRHSFLFETMLKPLRLGVPVIEIPTAWAARTEGKSSNTFFRNFVYLRPGLSIRFRDRAALLRPATDPNQRQHR